MSVVALLLAAATHAAAVSPADRRCRAAIGVRVPAAVSAAFGVLDRCHNRRDLGADVGDCNRGESVLALVTRRLAPLDRKCRNAAAVLATFPAGVPSTLATFVVAEVAASGRAVQGAPELVGKIYKRRCHRAIGQGRTALVRAFLTRVAACQGRRDRAASALGAFDPTCFDGRARPGVARIERQCRAITGAEVGSCAGLPDCVVDLAAATAHSIAVAMYGGTPGGGT